MDLETTTYRKVTRRLIPFLFACYILAYVDRVNIGFAKLQMQQDLGMSDTVYGIGAGIFFIGYFLFEVPANMLLERLGARLWLGGLMVLWGAVSCCTIFTRGAASFYAIRMLLGIVESGFFPGVILYMTFWYTRQHRARIVALFMSANPLSGVIAGPHLRAHPGEDVGGWRAARVAMAVPHRRHPFRHSGPGDHVLPGGHTGESPVAPPEERDCLLRHLAEEHRTKLSEGVVEHRLRDAFRSGKVWLFCLVYFGFQMANYGLAFWLPQILKDTLTKDPWKIGLLSAIPWGVAAISMVILAHHSDRTGERRWHVALAAGLGGLALAAGASRHLRCYGTGVLVTCTAVGIMCGQSVFWSLPMGLLSGAAAAAGIAWINSVGNLAGYLSPFLVGRIRDATGSMALVHFILGASFMISAIAVLVVAHRRPPVPPPET